MEIGMLLVLLLLHSILLGAESRGLRSPGGSAILPSRAPSAAPAPAPDSYERTIEAPPGARDRAPEMMMPAPVVAPSPSPAPVPSSVLHHPVSGSGGSGSGSAAMSPFSGGGASTAASQSQQHEFQEHKEGDGRGSRLSSEQKIGIGFAIFVGSMVALGAALLCRKRQRNIKKVEQGGRMPYREEL